MRSSSGVDFTAAPRRGEDGAWLLLGNEIFAGNEISLAPELTIFGQDLPEFRTWAGDNGVTSVHHITDFAGFFEQNHGLVVHHFGPGLSLADLKQINPRVYKLLEKATRLLLFIDITEDCTVERVRHVLRSQMPDLTFRIVYPRGVHKMSGIKMILIERRRPRIFLFVNDQPMAGKTESALFLAEAAAVRIVHGDEFTSGIGCGDIAAPDSLRQELFKLWDSSPLDHSLFAQFIEMIPAFKERTDVVFDLLLPQQKHAGVMEFFHQRGFFPILCLTDATQRRVPTTLEQAKIAWEKNSELRIASLKAEIDGYRKSTSWKLTAPWRFFGHHARAMARTMASLVDRSQRRP